MISQPPQIHGHRLIELLALEFADTAYQRQSTRAGLGDERISDLQPDSLGVRQT